MLALGTTPYLIKFSEQLTKRYMTSLNQTTATYQGVELLAIEQEAMLELERMVGEPIPVIGEVKWNTFGFTAESGHVIQLGIFNQELTSLSESIGNLTSLTYLYLGSNKLSSLPDTIGNLTLLKELSLYSNELTSLPDTIGNLSSLTYLNLEANQYQLTSLPERIGDLKSLTYLNLWQNQLTSLPERIGDLKSLQTLDLGYN
ncbi:hypothetical protein GF325_02790, partial [Candidatus Bathyarchaeota archaeon]|nr:hypothetical protein [Candidatus Bathyarchaeota archaeon]